MTRAATTNLLAAAPLLLCILTTGVVVGSSACTVPTGGKVVQTVLDVGDAVCEVLTANDIGGDKVQLICKYVDAADKTSHVFMATVPQEQAARMGIFTPAMLAKRSAVAPVASATMSDASSAVLAAPSAMPSASVSATPKATTPVLPKASASVKK